MELTADEGTWTRSPTSYSFQWQRCDSSGGSCADISGTTSSTYTLTSTDVGKTIRVAVTATNSAGSDSASSDATNMIYGEPENTAPPTITGAAHEAQTLTASHGTWTNSPTFTYQWQRCNSSGASCADISGATSSTYTLTSAEVDNTVRVVVTASNGAGSASASSTVTGVIDGLPINTVIPSVSGSEEYGETLTASPGTWSATEIPTYAYQWRRCNSSGLSCTNIAGATGSTYDLQANDVSKRIRVVVTASTSAGDASATSEPTGVIDTSDGTPENLIAPSLSDEPVVGSTITADSGLWNGSRPLSYTYQWQRCFQVDLYGASSTCSNISGATTETYVPRLDPNYFVVGQWTYCNSWLDSDYADAGNILSNPCGVNSRGIRLKVTATNVSGSSSSYSSIEKTKMKALMASSLSPFVNEAGIGHQCVGPIVDGGCSDAIYYTTTGGHTFGTQPITHTYRYATCDRWGNGCSVSSGVNTVFGSSGGVHFPDAHTVMRVYNCASNAYGGSCGWSAGYNRDGQPFDQPLAETPDWMKIGDGELAPNPTGKASDPVNTATGAFTADATDASLPADALPFKWTRSYNSSDEVSGNMDTDGRTRTPGSSQSTAMTWSYDQGQGNAWLSKAQARTRHLEVHQPNSTPPWAVGH